ncbi:MAG: flippase [bacterium]|nr:flippase [bacterium]
MSLTRKVAYNAAIQMTGKVISVSIGVLVIAMMTRYLRPEGYGYYTTIVAFLQTFGILIDFGLTLTTVQFLAAPNADTEKILGAMFGLRLVTVIPVLCVAIVAGFMMPYTPIVQIGIAILAFEFLAISVIQIVTGLFQRELRMERVAIAELSGRIVLLVGTFIAIALNGGLYAILFVITIASITTVAALLLFARRFTRICVLIDVPLWKKFLSTSWPIGISIAFNLLYLKGDTFILSLYRGPEEVGIYGAPYRVLEILAASPYLFIGLVFPLLRSTWLSDKERFFRILQKSFDALALIALPVVAGTIMLATPMMTFIAGPAFAPSGPLLQILALATGCIFIGALFGHIVLVVEKQRPMIWGYAALAVIAIAGYLFFIPRYGALGAAWMTVVVEALSALITYMVTRYTTNITLSLTTAGKALAASIVMMLALFALPSFHVLLLVVLGGTIYILTLLILRGIPKTILKEIFP